MTERMASFGLCVPPVLIQNENIWNFHSSVALETYLIFTKPLLYHCIKYDSFIRSVSNERKMVCFGLCVSPVLAQNEDILNFHGSLTLHKMKLM